MMNKNSICMKKQNNEQILSQWFNFNALTSWLADTKLMHRAARLYTQMLDEAVTPRQAVYYLYAQLSALAVLFPADINSGWRACAFLLFCRAVSFTRSSR